MNARVGRLRRSGQQSLDIRRNDKGIRFLDLCSSNRQPQLPTQKTSSRYMVSTIINAALDSDRSF